MDYEMGINNEHLRQSLGILDSFFQLCLFLLYDDISELDCKGFTDLQHINVVHGDIFYDM